MFNCYIICYNNGWLVYDTVQALRKFTDVKPIVVDNFSTGKRTQFYLDRLETEGITIIWCERNHGHTVVETIINPTEDIYLVTDPDLELSTLPQDTIQRLLQVSDAYQTGKVGVSLSIADKDDILEGIYTDEKTIVEWESQFWTRLIDDLLYRAEIDTTFALLNKKYKTDSRLDGIRIAGPYTVRHLPWHKSWIDTTNFSCLQEYLDTCRPTSTTAHLIRNYKFRSVTKNNQTFSVLNTVNKHFWAIYHNWENETFTVLDRFSDKSKTVIDIGSWIGPTVLYNSQRYKQVVAVEADRLSLEELKANIKINNIKNVKIVPNAIYNKQTTVYFGKNLVLKNSRENDSTSQIHLSSSDKNAYPVQTTTLTELFKHIDPSDIALVKVDIEGSEEYILEDLLLYNKLYKLPMFISFHYTWWNNKEKLNLLTADHAQLIRQYPFHSILFS